MPAMASRPEVLRGFEPETVRLDGVTKTVYAAGEGPPIIVMTEVPGITPKVASFARRLVAAGFSVSMPDLFGQAGSRPSLRSALSVMGRACIGREFSVLAKHEASPVTEWLRALARQRHEACGGPVGAIGMCLTGNFALTLCLDPWLMAPVLSQPSLPIGLAAARRSLHASPHTCATLQRRVRDQGLAVLGLRFTHDPLCPPERFAHLRELLGEGFEGIEIDSSSGNRWGHRRAAHSVLTEDLIDREGQPTQAALQRVLSFFEERLRPKTCEPPL